LISTETVVAAASAALMIPEMKIHERDARPALTAR
jgi:hypothetical protein